MLLPHSVSCLSISSSSINYFTLDFSLASRSTLQLVFPALIMGTLWFGLTLLALDVVLSGATILLHSTAHCEPLAAITDLLHPGSLPSIQRSSYSEVETPSLGTTQPDLFIMVLDAVTTGITPLLRAHPQMGTAAFVLQSTLPKSSPLLQHSAHSGTSLMAFKVARPGLLPLVLNHLQPGSLLVPQNSVQPGAVASMSNHTTVGMMPSSQMTLQPNSSLPAAGPANTNLSASVPDAARIGLLVLLRDYCELGVAITILKLVPSDSASTPQVLAQPTSLVLTPDYIATGALLALHGCAWPESALTAFDAAELGTPPALQRFVHLVPFSFPCGAC